MRLTIGQMCSHWRTRPASASATPPTTRPFSFSAVERGVFSHSPAHMPSIIVASVGMKLSVDQPPAVEAERRLAREQVQEPDVERPRQVRVLVEVREEAGVEVRPVGGHADAACSRSPAPAADTATNAAQKPTRIAAKTATWTRTRRERQQEQERVAEADLRQRVLERPVRLRPLERAQEDAEQDQGDAAPDRVHEHALEGLAPGAAARDRKRQRRADEERERRLNQIVERAALPRDVRRCCRRRSPRSALAGKAVCSVHSRIASASIRNITKPRKASIDVTRVTAGEIAGACVTGRGAAGSVATLLIMVAFYAWSPDSEPAPDYRQPNAERRAPSAERRDLGSTAVCIPLSR